MSLKYLYIVQKPNDCNTVTIYNTSHLMPGLQHVKYTVPHVSSTPFDVIQNYLTSKGVMYSPTKLHSKDPSIITSYNYLMQGKCLPIHKFYLATHPLQAEVLLKLYTKVTGTNNDHIISNLNSSVEAIIGRIDNIDTACRMSITADIMNDVDKKIKEHHNIISARDEYVSSVIQSLIGITSSMSREIKELYTTVEHLRETVSALETKVDAKIDARVDAKIEETINATVTSIKTEINTIKDDIEGRHYINDKYFEESDEDTTEVTLEEKNTDGAEPSDEQLDTQPAANDTAIPPADVPSSSSEIDAQMKRSWLWF